MLQRSSNWFPVQLLLCGALLASGLSTTLSAQTSKDDTGSAILRQQMNAAHHAEQSGNPDEAALHYRAFLLQALEELALDHAQLGDYARTSAYFDEALQLTPDSWSLHREYALAALQANDLPRAETMARFLLAHPPQQNNEVARAHQLLGRILLRISRYQEAKSEMEASISLDSSFENQYGLAVVCLDMDDEGCAVRIFDEMLRTLGDTPALHMQLGRAYGNSDFAPRAVAEFRKAIAEAPRLPGAHYSLAAALLSAGSDESTTREAEKELKQELAISPHDFLTWAALGKLAADGHRTAEAESNLKQAIALNPQNPDAWLYLGQLYFDNNRPAEAENALRMAIQHTTDLARNRYQIQKAHFLLGRILMQQHHEEQAHAEMQIAHTLANKTLSKDKNQLAGMLTGGLGQSGPTASGVETPGNAAALPGIADAKAVSQQEEFEKHLIPAIADSYNNLGVIAAGKNDYENAYLNFAHASAWNPQQEGLDYNLGRAAFMASRFAAAIAPLTRQLHAHPEDSGMRNALAMSQFMTQDYSGCLATLKPVQATLTAIPQIQYIAAEALVKTGQTALGQEQLEVLKAAHPEIGDVHRSLAELDEQRGAYAQAVEELHAALRLNASDAAACFDLGRIELAQGHASAAVSALEAAVRLAPANADYHHELASAYQHLFRLGDAEKQRQIYERLRSQATGGGAAAPKQ